MRPEAVSPLPTREERIDRMTGGELDVLVSHTPPADTTLDRTVSGTHVGSRAVAEVIAGRRPRLFVCGHIHEGYGFEVVRFGSDDCEPTLVVNAANANTGKANKLCRAPVVVEIPPLAEPVGTGPPAEDAEQRQYQQ